MDDLEPSTTRRVALRKESVDRNLVGGVNRTINIVALRKESVDRNETLVILAKQLDGVALRKESVDRNYFSDKDADWVRVSLSARRAWIEMLLHCLSILH